MVSVYGKSHPVSAKGSSDENTVLAEIQANGVNMLTLIIFI
jgi:hypothetical protein